MRNAIALIALAALSICAVSCSRSSSPSQVVQKYYELAEKGDVEGCVKLTSKQDLDKENGPFMARLEAGAVGGAIHDNKGMKSLVIKKETVTGESADVDVEIQLNNGKSDQMKYKLVKEEKEWRLRNGI